MKLKLHKYASDEVVLMVEAENETEKDLIDFFFKNESRDLKANAHSGLFFIHTGKKLK